MSIIDKVEVDGTIYDIVGGGLLPHLVIEADPSSTVTVSKEQTSITATETSSGIYECDVAEFGIYTINGTLNGASVEGTLVVDTVMVYNYAFTIPVPEGATVTPVNDIQTWLKCAGLDKEYTTLAEVLADEETFDILLRDSNACDYMARSTDWALAEGLVPVMTSDTTPSGVASASSVLNNYNAYLAFDGNKSTYWEAYATSATLKYEFPTVVTVSRVRLYVAENNQTVTLEGSNDDTTYTSILDSFTLVAGEDTFKKVANPTPYKYYRATVTKQAGSWAWLHELQFYAADITTDADAMRRVGMYDYCSNALLGNSTWLNAIGNSTYVESILGIKVPTMTSRTTPYGKVIAPADTGISNTQAWKAFDGTSHCWYYNANHTIGYQFTGEPIIVKKFTIQNRFDTLVAPPKKFNFVGSNDEGTTWTVIKSNLECLDRNYATIMDFEVPENETAYQAYGIQTTEMYDNAVWIAELQFYGRKSISDTYYPLVPTMTSNTTPSGEVSSSSANASYPAWKAFDGDNSSVWYATEYQATNQWLRYDFGKPTVVCKARIKPAYSNSARLKNIIIQASNDTETWQNIATYQIPNADQFNDVEFNNDTAYRYWQMYVTDNYGDPTIGCATLQFYEKITKGIIHSAPNDTIYTLDENLEPVILCYTNGEGIGELDYADFGAKNVRFFSSIAKDLSDLTKEYSKLVKITNTIYGGTTEIYLMPDCVRTLYWFGNEVNCEDKTTANGWRMDQVFTNPIRNTNSITFVTSDAYHMCQIGAKYSVGDFTTINVLVMNSSGQYKQLDSNLVKNFEGTQTERYYYENIASLTKVSWTPTNIKSGFPSTGTQTGTLQICAFWVE